MLFKKEGYIIIKNTIHKELTDFIYKYFLLKRQVAKTYFETNHIEKNSLDYGTWLADPQVPNTYSVYSDIVMETLLTEVMPKMEDITNLKLIPTYSYARIYKYGDVLAKHKDRPSCEISTTLNLGGDPWPIYLKSKNESTIRVDLLPGDMLVYKGCELEHWREKFTGQNCGQVFLHYNNKETEGSMDNVYDNRPHLGLSLSFKYRNIK
jgi:hypothetical protein